MGQMPVEPLTRAVAVETPTGLRARRADRCPPTLPRDERLPARWWLWPHLLGLDAPLVALSWQDWWSRTERVPLAISQRALLGLGVWLIYLADRLADTTRGAPGDCATARHAFARTHRHALLVLATVVAATLVVLAPCVLPASEFGGGLLLLAAAGAYFWLIHRRRSQRWTARLPKEAAVGGMFALGTAFFAWCRPGLPAWTFVAAVVLFGAVCFANCALITSWERNLCDPARPVLVPERLSLAGHGRVAFAVLAPGGCRRLGRVGVARPDFSAGGARRFCPGRVGPLAAPRGPRRVALLGRRRVARAVAVRRGDPDLPLTQTVLPPNLP